MRAFIRRISRFFSAKPSLLNLYYYYLIRRSGLFDSTFYRSKYKDIPTADVNPLMHYIQHGWHEGRNPSAEFSTLIYCENYIDVRLSKKNPLIHYIKQGRKEGRVACALEVFNPYANQYQNSLANSNNDQKEDFVPEVSNLPIINPKVKVIAFYLPQYHPIPENDEWWGKGFTEWSNVSKAIPQFVEHYQPRLPGELGFYDLRVPQIQERQIELAKNYGIFGFCFHYYWFSGKRLLSLPLDQFINDKSNKFPFCICWANENWTKRWDGQDNEILISQVHNYETDKNFIHDLIPLFEDPRYINVDNRPLLIIYRPDIFSELKTTLDYWREYSAKQKINNPYILAAQTFGYVDPREQGFDGAIEFPPHNLGFLNQITDKIKVLNPDFEGNVWSYSGFVNEIINKLQVEPYKLFRTVVPGWDNHARKRNGGVILHGSSPEVYGNFLERVCEFTLNNHPNKERIVFVNAWNEWAEGAYLEPDRRFGYAYLQKTYDVISSL